ncbi:PH domain-containing protein [Actinospica sp.]|uniref:PH domain-containing protein n=1 Tax=Actinospica sp. TaxID=1872142 RepID=UPI002CAE3C3E|nr:PH domain-containing protein [Actinospica sp.]HWG23485.1 PH domain-containing protein [Actinospica sp.]
MSAETIAVPAPPQGVPSPDAWLRLSPRALAVRPITDLLRSAPVLIGLLYEGTRGGHQNYWGLCVGAFAVLAGIWRWFGTKYQVTDDRVYIRRGLLSPRVLSAPRAGVRSVDLTAHVMYRLLGVARVKIGTGRNDRREGENFHLDALSVADAEALRSLLLAAPRTRGAARVSVGDTDADTATAARAVPPPESEIVRLRASWIRFAPLTLTGLVILGVLVGFVTNAEHDAGVDLAALGPVHSGIHDVTRMSLAESIPVGSLAVVLGLVTVSVLGYIAVFWNFRLVRTGTGSLRVTRGLLSTRATTIDEARLRGVEISEPLSLRAAKGARCIAITTGLRAGGGAERGGSVLLPPAPRAVADRVAAEILGVPAEICSMELPAHGRAALRRRETRAVAPILVLYAASQTTLLALGVRLPYWALVILVIALVLGFLIARDRYRGLGHRLVGDWIVLSTGSLVRRRSILNVRGVIGWQLRQTWFQRRRDLVTMTVTTAAGKQRYSVADVPMTEALAFAAAATPDLVPQFLAPYAGHAA